MMTARRPAACLPSGLRGWFAVSLLTFAAAPSQAAPPQRIADAWYAHNAMLALLGASPQVVATVAKPAVYPWMYRVAPALAKAKVFEGGVMNAEELLRLHAQLVFVTTHDPVAAALQQAGLKVVKTGFNNFTTMLDCLQLTARLLDTPLARQRALDYQSYLSAVERQLDGRRQALRPDQRPRVLHIASLQPLKVDGDGTIVDEWIRLAGGRNAARGLHGNQQPVSIEQILAWRPQIIILGGQTATLTGRSELALWKILPAVRQGKVYRNPYGVFPWDRYGPELALQLRWAQQVILDGKPDLDTMTRLTRAFYQRFFDYTLSPADARRILLAEPPPKI